MAKKVVVIGGGTGSYTVLRGLKNYNCNITAVVSMADSGGSTGVLRDEYGVLPPGDIRRALVALSEESEVTKDLMKFRFKNGSFKGHTVGNIILTALKEITGSDRNAIEAANRILKIKGKVLPVTLNNSTLYAELEDGVTLKGQANITQRSTYPIANIKKVFLLPMSNANNETTDEIKEADIIVIGPGDLYTSVIPNLLVKGIPEAIRKSKAEKIYVCNIMTKYAETHKFSVSDHVEQIKNYFGCYPDKIIVNNAEAPEDLLLKYKAENAFPVVNDSSKLRDRIKKIIEADLITKPVLIRHDPDKLACAILGIK
ncbi:YvcK family protein [Candidatus Woesearchaeota archaeon]|nr:YvcK family protein [Candidatus Woesearchaeota archaeon]